MEEREIEMKVLDELDREPDLDDTFITVKVNKENIILQGKVPTDYERSLAGKAAERAIGKGSVLNKVVVDPSHMRGDAEIGTASQRKLMRLKDFPAKRTEVEVENGWVTLRGRVHSREQKKKAEEVVKEINGVAGVANKLTVDD